METTDIRARRGTIVVALVSLIALVAMLAPAGVVSAHTDFESSLPADGTTVDTAVTEIVISFTAAAEPAGDGFQVLDADGVLREPTSITVEADRIFRLGFEPPLAGGTIGVRWSVRAGDAHPISGAFSFVVTAPAPTTVPTTSATTTPISPTSVAAGDSSNDTSGAATGSADSSEVTAAPAAPANSTAAANEAAEEAAELTAGAPSLEEFLTVDERPAGDGIARAGRLIGFGGIVFGLGALAFASAVLIGTRREVRAVLRSVRVLGAVIAVGAIVEYVGVARLLDESIGSAWSTEPGVATMLRLVGGIALAVGVRATIVGRRSPAALSADVAVRAPSNVVEPAASGSSQRARWKPDRRSWPAAAGVVVLLASFWFDGHTVTKGFRPLHALVDTVHVAAGSVWVGGVAALAAVAWSRDRNGETRRFGELVVRFSSVATIALIAVAVAGSAMTLMITDSLGDLTETEWGQVLLLKLAAVAVAAAFGAYHHFRLRPALEADPDDPRLLVTVRDTLTAEAIVLAFVVVVTVWLVVAAT